MQKVSHYKKRVGFRSDSVIKPSTKSGTRKMKVLSRPRRIAYSRSPFGRKGYRGRKDTNKVQFFDRFGKQVRPLLTYLDLRWMVLPLRKRRAIMRHNFDAGYSIKRFRQIRKLLWTIVKLRKKLLWINVHGFWYCVSGIKKMIFNGRQIPFRGRGSRRYKKLLGMPQSGIDAKAYVLDVRRRQLLRYRKTVRHYKRYRILAGYKPRKRGRVRIKFNWRTINGYRIKKRTVLTEPRGFRKRSYMRRSKNVIVAGMRRVGDLEDLQHYKQKLVVLKRNFRNALSGVFTEPEYKKLLTTYYFSPAHKQGRLEHFISRIERKLVFIIPRIPQYAPRHKTVALLCDLVSRGSLVVNGKKISDIHYQIENMDLLEYNYIYYFVEFQYHRALLRKRAPFFFFRQKRTARLWRYGALADKIIHLWLAYTQSSKIKETRDLFFLLRRHPRLSWNRRRGGRRNDQRNFNAPQQKHGKKGLLRLKEGTIRSDLIKIRRRRRMKRFFAQVPKRLRKRRVARGMGAFANILPRYKLPSREVRDRRKLRRSWYEFSRRCVSVIIFRFKVLGELPLRRFTRKHISTLMLFGKLI